jgi:hypothetical protein
MTDKELQGKSLQHLLSITDVLPQELTRDAAELACPEFSGTEPMPRLFFRFLLPTVCAVWE